VNFCILEFLKKLIERMRHEGGGPAWTRRLEPWRGQGEAGGKLPFAEGY
jgi:hypothetical protein